MPASSARGFSYATMPVISPIFLSRSTLRRQAGALRLTLAASATFEMEASLCNKRRMALSVRSIAATSAFDPFDTLRTFVAHMMAKTNQTLL
jgi:hypothetical protein